MKKRNLITATLWLMLFSGCISKPDRAEKTPIISADSNVPVTSAKPTTAATPKGSEKVSEEDIPEGCARGVAEPIVKKEVFPNSTFSLNPDKISGVETVSFKNGDKLLIKNEGCEYYALTFQFETARFKTEPDDAYGWAENTVVLMKEIEKGINPPIEVAKGTESLESLLQQTVHFEFGEELDFGGEDIRSYLILDKAEKLGGNKYRVEVSYMVGPL